MSPVKKLRRILIVEDESLVALDIKSTLQKSGFTVVGICSSGEDALRSVHELHPNLVLMDILLKGRLDGITTAETIKKEQDIPIIFLTAHTDTPTRSRAEEVGPAGYVVKPFREQELLKAINSALT